MDVTKITINTKRMNSTKWLFLFYGIIIVAITTKQLVVVDDKYFGIVAVELFISAFIVGKTLLGLYVRPLFLTYKNIEDNPENKTFKEKLEMLGKKGVNKIENDNTLISMMTLKREAIYYSWIYFMICLFDELIVNSNVSSVAFAAASVLLLFLRVISERLMSSVRYAEEIL